MQKSISSEMVKVGHVLCTCTVYMYSPSLIIELSFHGLSMIDSFINIQFEIK